MAWVPHDNGRRRCDVHGVVFGKTTTCSACPPGLPVAQTLIAEVDSNKELDLLESEIRAEARYYRKLGREWCAASPAERSIGLKAAEISLKFDRAYKEILEERKSREHDMWLVRENAKLQSKAAPD